MRQPKIRDNLSDKEKIKRFIEAHLALFIEAISSYYPMSRNFISQNSKILSWEYVMWNNQVIKDFDFYSEYRNFIVWEDLFLFNTLCHMDDHIAFLDEFKEFLNWKEFCEDISDQFLTDEVIIRFEDYIDWQCLSRNEDLNFSEEIIERYKDKLNWDSLCATPFLPWSEDFIQRYSDRLNWKLLSQNAEIPWSTALIKKFNDKWDPKCLQKNPHVTAVLNGESYGDPDLDDDAEVIHFNINKDDEETDNNEFTDANGKLKSLSKEEFEIMLENFNPQAHSRNPMIPWSEGLIEFLKDDWDWSCLSENIGLPWTEDLIARYEDRWEWGRFIPDCDESEYKDKECYVISGEMVGGLSANKAIPWTLSMIKRFKDKIYWAGLMENKNVEWTIDILTECLPFLVSSGLSYSPGIWKKAVFPFIDEEFISEVIKNARQHRAESVGLRDKNTVITRFEN